MLNSRTRPTLGYDALVLMPPFLPKTPRHAVHNFRCFLRGQTPKMTFDLSYTKKLTATMGTTLKYPMPSPTQKPLHPFSLKIVRAVSAMPKRWPSPTAPPTCIRRRMISSGYDDVWETRPAKPPAASSAQYLSTGGASGPCFGDREVVYGAKADERSRSPAVSCVRNDMPAYGSIPTSVGEKPR